MGSVLWGHSCVLPGAVTLGRLESCSRYLGLWLVGGCLLGNSYFLLHSLCPGGHQSRPLRFSVVGRESWVPRWVNGEDGASCARMFQVPLRRAGWCGLCTGPPAQPGLWRAAATLPSSPQPSLASPGVWKTGEGAQRPPTCPAPNRASSSGNSSPGPEHRRPPTARFSRRRRTGRY